LKKANRFYCRVTIFGRDVGEELKNKRKWVGGMKEKSYHAP
jgi:hypothetical protein